jgi:hypothetical protein
VSDTDSVLAGRVAVAVLGCPSVESLTAGPQGTCTTYGPGVRVDGVCIRPGAVEVHLVSRWGVPAMEVADEVRSALQPDLPGRVVDVVIEGISDVPVAAPAGIGAVS